MIKCPVCNELITPSSVSYKASSGFLDSDGTFHEQDSVIIHKECHYNYFYNPFEKLEEDVKNS
tara:strand:+ start:3218 stop:3406 length:189 start_codon:yes stop_codon:yes gene_type:complete